MFYNIYSNNAVSYLSDLIRPTIPSKTFEPFHIVSDILSFCILSITYDSFNYSSLRNLDSISIFKTE